MSEDCSRPALNAGAQARATDLPEQGPHVGTASRRRFFAGTAVCAGVGLLGLPFAADVEASAVSVGDEAISPPTRRVRPYSWDDALRRSEIVTAEVSPQGRAALVITRPLDAVGAHFDRPRPAVVSRGELWLCDAGLSSRRKLDLDDRWVWAPAFSPDGAWLAALATDGDGRVGLAIWEVSTGEVVIHDQINVDIYGRFRTAECEDQAPLSFAQSALQFCWVDNDRLMFITAAEDETQFDLAGPSSAATFERLRNKAFNGEVSVRTWTPGGATCFVGRRLIALDRASGVAVVLHSADIRGVSLSPDRNWIAILNADRRVEIDPAARQSAPLRYTGPADDPMVSCSLDVVGLRDGQSFTAEGVASVGNAAPSRLPVWSRDSKRVALASRQTYSSTAVTGDDACWEVDVPAQTTRRWSAASSADAEFMACLVAASETADVSSSLEARSAITDPSMIPGGQVRARAWVLAQGVVLKWADARLSLVRGANETVLCDVCAAVASPIALTRGGHKIVVRRMDGRFDAFTVLRRRQTRHRLQTPANAVLLCIGPDGSILCKQDASDGSAIYRSQGAERASAAPFILNRHLADVRLPVAREIVRTTVDGERLVGVLQTPTVPTADGRYPVVVWAYPNSVPAAGRGVAQLNSAYAVAYPFQYLLARGYAVFQPPMPMGDRADDVDPLEHVSRMILPWLDALDQQPDVLPGEYGFWGHSDAGFAALALAATTDRFKAIAAASTFPDLAATVYASNLSIQSLDCSAQLIQANRFYYEAEDQHYRVGGSLWRNPDGWSRGSAVFRLEHAVTPMLLMVGEYDAAPRAMEEVYSVLHGKGVPVELAYYWGEGHVIMSRGNLHDLWTRSEQFFGRYLRPNDGA